VTGYQTVVINFDHSMPFPSDLIDIINNQTTQSESQSDQIGVTHEQQKQNDTVKFVTIHMVDGDT